MLHDSSHSSGSHMNPNTASRQTLVVVKIHLDCGPYVPGCAALSPRVRLAHESQIIFRRKLRKV